MAVITTEIAVGAWENRKTLTYAPCNQHFEGIGFFDETGRAYNPGCGADSPKRRPYKVETDMNVTYLMYDAGQAAIFRITTVE
jgi:hypothetical protein